MGPNLSKFYPDTLPQRFYLSMIPVLKSIYLLHILVLVTMMQMNACAPPSSQLTPHPPTRARRSLSQISHIGLLAFDACAVAQGRAGWDEMTVEIQRPLNVDSNGIYCIHAYAFMHPCICIHASMHMHSCIHAYAFMHPCMHTGLKLALQVCLTCFVHLSL
jgi:hypothetical protein